MSIPYLVRVACTVLLLGSAGLAAARNVTDPDAPRQLEDDGPVSVSWNDPATFTEIRYSGNRWEAERGDWVDALARHMRDRIARVLPPGQTMAINITDIDRAGDYEPGRGFRSDQIRVVRDIYPPRMEFDYTRTGAGGQVIDQGHAKLRDMAYLSQSNLRYQSDDLAYEKRLVDRWVEAMASGDGG
ncbi:DUF3016 domain-containing protein [Marilutibacter aestuarii]|uniref:DUF3016 domain-containing protein n=1 Tax=Marilutibacter aestuarii TaxID=1706195 RepID=A0A508ANZ9_9GAMM|nr:DUF3016 domain-containing protein [Lysobacter aestuarii]TQD51187.1 DUF3016 domain-containing protein [Lysobacter aestuarii]